MIRKDILTEKIWEFTESFDGFNIPNSLATLLNLIITGPKSKIASDCTKKQEVDKSVQMLSEIIIGIVKTDRQVKYKSSSGDTARFRNQNQTPFTAGLGLHFHKITMSEELVDTFNDLSFSISYDKVLKIETAIANSVIKGKRENNNVYIPPNVVKVKMLPFAIDNTDFNNDTPDGKHEFHGAGQIVSYCYSETK